MQAKKLQVLIASFRAGVERNDRTPLAASITKSCPSVLHLSLRVLCAAVRGRMNQMAPQPFRQLNMTHTLRKRLSNNPKHAGYILI